LYGSGPSYFCSAEFFRRFAQIGINRNRRDKDIAFDVVLQNLRGIAHPRRQRCRVVDHYIPLPIFERVEFAVAITDELLHFGRQFARVRLSAIECCDLVSAAQRVADLIGAGKTGAAKNQDA